MWIPKGMTEEEVLKVMETVINQLIKNIRPFGYYSKGADLRQQAYLFAIEALNTQRYDSLDGKRPLGGFLRTCIINRFISLSRDKFCRTEQPCHRCPFNDPEMKINQSACGVFDDKQKCEKYKVYFNRNKVKRNLMNLKADPIFEDTLSKDHKAFVDIDNKDLIENICSKLTPENRETFKELLAENKVKKYKFDKLREQIAEEFGVKIDDRAE